MLSSEAEKFFENARLGRQINDANGRRRSSRIGRRISESAADLPLQLPDTFLAIVQVRESQYVPNGVELREWIGPNILTATIPFALMNSVQQDPKVIKVEISKSIPCVPPMTSI